MQPGYVALHERGELARRGRLLWAAMGACNLCPRQCGTNRLAGGRGECGASVELAVAASHPHFGEEAGLVGRGGSGTIFFTHCSLRCAFCLNWEISQGGEGSVVSIGQLAALMLRLQAVGCHNLNLVTPTHYAAHILLALDQAAASGLRVPVVYNTSGWERVEILRLLDGVVAIYLADFKYGDAARAARYSAGAGSYPAVAQSALVVQSDLHALVSQTKPPQVFGSSLHAPAPLHTEMCFSMNEPPLVVQVFAPQLLSPVG